MDLGATIKMEFVGLDLANSEKLKAGLEKETAIGAVWVRSIDAAAVSVIECESRINSTDLAKVVSKVLPEYGLDRSEKRYLSFRKGGVKREQEATATAAAAGAPAQEQSGGMLWEIIIGVAVSACGGIGAIIMKVIKKKIGA
jgi:hypothetical protein